MRALLIIDLKKKKKKQKKRNIYTFLLYVKRSNKFFVTYTKSCIE